MWRMGISSNTALQLLEGEGISLKSTQTWISVFWVLCNLCLFYDFKTTFLRTKRSQLHQVLERMLCCNKVENCCSRESERERS